MQYHNQDRSNMNLIMREELHKCKQRDKRTQELFKTIRNVNCTRSGHERNMTTKCNTSSLVRDREEKMEGKMREFEYSTFMKVLYQC